MSGAGLMLTVVSFISALAILVVFHEMGHYLMARLCNVKVLRFSFGFGKILYSRRSGPDNTEWALCAIPLGGYVKMADEREGDVAPADIPRAFNRQSLRARTLIVLAGPLANLLLAAVFFALVGMLGVKDFRAQIAAPLAGSVAEHAGLVAGDHVVAVDGTAIDGWSSLRWTLTERALDGDQVELRVASSSGVQRSLHLKLPSDSALDPETDLLRSLGLLLARPRIDAVIGDVKAGSRADQSGMKRGDRIISVDGHPIGNWSEFAERARAAPERSLVLDLVRDGQPIETTVTPALVEEGGQPIGRIGASALLSEDFVDDRIITITYTPLAALGYGLRQVWETTTLTLRLIGRMLTGSASLKNISGPVTIADYAGKSAELGISAYLRFLALISVSLGVLNLLPIPVLDGGHLLYYLFEATRGRPLSERAMAMGQQFGLAVLALLMMFAFYNDFTRLFSG